MKITKYICDICKTEVGEEDDLRKIPHYKRLWNYVNGYEIEEIDACEDCIEKYSSFIDDELMKK